jgi:hypothetical protein
MNIRSISNQLETFVSSMRGGSEMTFDGYITAHLGILYLECFYL